MYYCIRCTTSTTVVVSKYLAQDYYTLNYIIWSVKQVLASIITYKIVELVSIQKNVPILLLLQQFVQAGKFNT